MQPTLLSGHRDHEHDHTHDESCSACGHEHAPARLWQTLTGVVFVLNAFIIDWLFGQPGHTVASASAFIGAIVLGYPIVINAMNTLQRGVLRINELVTLPIL